MKPPQVETARLRFDGVSVTVFLFCPELSRVCFCDKVCATVFLHTESSGSPHRGRTSLKKDLEPVL